MIYHLSTCDTCKRILKEIEVPEEFKLQDIKSHPITAAQLEEMKQLSGDYESLFSRRARLYQEKDLKNKDLKEEDYRDLILEHYTFLKRPVIFNGEHIFIGNSKKNVAAAKRSIHEQ